MRMLSWNIRRGGPRTRTEEVVRSIIRHDADIINLLEFRDGSDKGRSMRQALRENGWVHQHASYPHPGICHKDGILVASRVPYTRFESGSPQLSQYYDEIFVRGLHALMVHAPTNELADEFWDTLQARAHELRGMPGLIVGDFNTCAQAKYTEVTYRTRYVKRLQRLLSTGWFRTYRGERDAAYSHVTRQGSRTQIDMALVSEALKNRVNSEYSHTEIVSGLSDHAAVVVTVED